MSLAGSLAEAMSECGPDATELAAEMADNGMTPVEARRIWNHWKEDGVLGSGQTIVSWQISEDQWIMLSACRCHGKISMHASTTVPVINAWTEDEDGDAVEEQSREHYHVCKHVGGATSPEQAVRDMLDYRHAPKCAGFRTTKDCKHTRKPTLYSDISDDYTSNLGNFYDIRFISKMQCINVVHKEGALCGECLANKFFNTKNYKNDVNYIYHKL